MPFEALFVFAQSWLHPVGLFADEESDGRNAGRAQRGVRAFAGILQRGGMRRETPPADGAGQAKLIERQPGSYSLMRRARICFSQALAGISKPCNWRRTSSRPRSPLSCDCGAMCCQRNSQRMNCAGGDRLNLLAQCGDREVMNAREQAALAPLDGCRPVTLAGEVAAQDRAAASRRSRALSTSAGREA